GYRLFGLWSYCLPGDGWWKSCDVVLQGLLRPGDMQLILNKESRGFSAQQHPKEAQISDHTAPSVKRICSSSSSYLAWHSRNKHKFLDCSFLLFTVLTQEMTTAYMRVSYRRI
ncbi:hypothetical protein Tsubulata_029485, partial [Turnera subulata]